MSPATIHYPSTLTPWRAFFWEPVAGTSERLMVGLVFKFDDRWQSTRIIRDDVLDALYGKSAGSAVKLIEFALDLYLSAAQATDDVDSLAASLAGLYPGPVRRTAATSVAELLRTAALMYSSLARADIFDMQDDADPPQAEEVTRRFGTEVRDTVLAQRPDLSPHFGRSAQLTEGGALVKFGFLSHKAIIHFTVLSPVRQSASVKDARAKLWELSRASALSGISQAALIAATPRQDDPTLGPRQKENLRANKLEVEREADQNSMRLHAVTSVEEASERVLEMAA